MVDVSNKCAKKLPYDASDFAITWAPDHPKASSSQSTTEFDQIYQRNMYSFQDVNLYIIACHGR